MQNNNLLTLHPLFCIKRTKSKRNFNYLQFGLISYYLCLDKLFRGALIQGLRLYPLNLIRVVPAKEKE
jgi:hypothetical protein